MDSLRLYVVTYNVNKSMPEQDLHDLLSLSPTTLVEDNKSLPDFYVLCLQEVEAKPLNLVRDALLDDRWTYNFTKILRRRDYVKVKTVRLQGLVLNLFCLRKHLMHIGEMEYTFTRTGLLGFWGNKGAVTIRLTLYGCSICFLNSRFHPNDSALSSRISDYNAIINAQIFHVPKYTDIFLHDYVIWAGDMNFGLMSEYSKSAADVLKKIQGDKVDDLLEHDQLRFIMDSGKAFGLFMENIPTFLPTYKFKIGTDQYDTNLNDTEAKLEMEEFIRLPPQTERIRPAWADRILYRVSSGNPEISKLTVNVESYKSFPAYTLSDHKPVAAEFTIQVRGPLGGFISTDIKTHPVKFEKIPALFVRGERTCAIFEFTKNATKYNNDWVAIFEEGFAALDDYLASALVRDANKLQILVDPPTKNGPNGIKVPPTLPSPTKYSIKFYELSRHLTVTQVRLIYFSCSDCKVQAILGISEPINYAQK